MYLQNENCFHIPRKCRSYSYNNYRRMCIHSIQCKYLPHKSYIQVVVGDGLCRLDLVGVRLQLLAVVFSAVSK